MCGGIPSKDVSVVFKKIVSISDHVLFVEVDTNIYEAKRRINFKRKIINNELLATKKNILRKSSIGTFSLVNQIKTARKQGFTHLHTYAEGGRHITPPDKWVGHYVWGRLGYEMDELSIPNFQDLMKQENRPESNLWELLSTEEGRNFWKKKGEGWNGTFDLNKKSPCRKVLKRYLKEKRYLVRI